MIKRITAFCMSIILALAVLPMGAFATVSAAACVVEFYDALGGTKIDTIADQQNVYAKVKFTAPADGDAVVVTAKYDDSGALQIAATEKAEGLTGGEEVVYQTEDINVSGADSVKVFVLDGLNNLVPAASNYGVIEKEEGLNASVTENVRTVDGETASAVTLSAGKVTADVAQGTKLQSGASSLTLTVTKLEKSESGISAGENEVLLPIDIHVDGIAEENTVPVIVMVTDVLSVGLNKGNLALYHVEGGKAVQMEEADSLSELTRHNQFHYDPATGTITLAMATFSEVVAVSDTENAWNGEIKTDWYNATDISFTIANADQLAGFGQIVGGMNVNTRDSFTGKIVTLAADINLGDKESENNTNIIFHPIGYYYTEDKNSDETTGDVYSTVKSFEGTFDGNGHKIANFYQNTWEIKGDYNEGYPEGSNHYKDAMGLFGYVSGGTVKNLTVDNFSSDGEFTPTGVIAAYADGDATFENIAITKCNPRVYNTGNGGIIGVAGSTSADDDDHITLKNITVDNSNKISALWGSWDVACGGLVGMYRGNVDDNGAETGDTISFKNCHVAAQIDVYNDVCANYQYYAYRYAGMIIGSVRHNTKNTDSKTIPNMTGISATGCTVNYGDWNDYYYCEFEKNSLASYSEDYQFSRVDKSEIIFDESENVTGCTHEHTDKEDKTAVYLPFHQLFTGYSWGVSSIGLEKYSGIVTNLDITEGDKKESVEKFETKFTGDFLYRVGNQNAVSLDSLFVAIDDGSINDSGVTITIDKVDENTNVSGAFTANKDDWKQGTIQFSGTGVVKVTIQDYNYCKPTTLYLEVVDAVNATSAASATSNNVVLLKDVSGTFTVSNGYTFYGNGFKVTLPTTSQSNYSSGFVGYVNLNSGNLDNVQIIGPVYPEMYIYRDQAKDSTDTTKANYFYNSVIVNGGNCTISNSYISGSRTAICIRGGNNVVIENTTLSGGAYANMQIAGASNVTLRDLTTVQTDVLDSYEKGKSAHGLGIAVDSNVVDIYIEGELNQYNWLCKEQWNSIVPSTYKSSFPNFFGDNTFSKYWHYLNGGTDPYVNMAFIYACNWNTDRIHDKRTTVDYETCHATIAGVSGGVYSKVNTVRGNSIAVNDLADPGYTSTGFNPVAPVFNFDNTANNDADDETDAADTYCVYDEDSGILKIGITGDSKTIDLSGVSVTKNGVNLECTSYLNETQIPENSVTVNSGNGTKQTLTFKTTTNDCGYDKDGNPIEGEMEYTWTVTVEFATLAYPAPVWNMGGEYTFDTSNCYYAYYQTSQGYGEAVPIYEGVKVNYYNKSGTLVELDLSKTTTLPTGSNNANANAFTYTLSDGSTLTMKFVSGWKSGATTHQFTAYNSKAYIYPQSLDNDNYVRAKTTNQDFNVKISYTFTDSNGQSTETVTMNWYNAAASNGSVSTVQWKTFDSTNGKEPECITPETLITLADGTQKEVQYLTEGEELLVWNLKTGSYDKAPIVFNESEEETEQEIVHLYFSDGSDVEVIFEHGFFDINLGKYVYIRSNNAKNYVGHKFVKQGDIGKNTWEAVTLTNVVLEKKVTTPYSPVTFEHLCYYTDGVLSMPGGIEGMFNIFEVDTDTMAYDEKKMARDIESYGLFSYDDFKEIIPEYAYEAFNGKYLKVAIGKGNITWEDILRLAERYGKYFN